MNGIVFATLLALVAAAGATQFTDCGSSGTVSKVEVSDCPDSEDTCILKKGTKPSISIQFQSKTQSNTIKAVVHGVIAGVPLPFPLPKAQSDGCKSGVTCPMTPGQSFTYTNAIDVKTQYPSLGVTVRWELKDDKSSDVVCVELPCEIQ